MVPLRSSPQFAHLNAMPYFLSDFLPSSCLFSALLQCHQWVLHPQSLHVSQCPSDSASCLCLQSKPTRCMQGAHLTSSAVTVSLSVQDQHGKQKALWNRKGKGIPSNPGPAEGGWGHLDASFLTGPPQLDQRKLLLSAHRLPHKAGVQTRTWTPTATHIPQDWVTRAAGGRFCVSPLK